MTRYLHIALIMILMGSGLLHAAPRPAGFREFRLGMTRAEVNAIIAATEWELYQERGNSSNPHHAESMRVTPAGAGDPEYRWNFDNLSEIQKTLLSIGYADPARSNSRQHARSVRLEFFQDTLMTVELTSMQYSASNDRDIPQWVRTAESSITEHYGDAARYSMLHDNLNSRSMGKVEEGSYMLSEWQVSPHRAGREQTITVSLVRGGWSFSDPFSVKVTMTDNALRDAKQGYRLMRNIDYRAPNGF